MAKIWSDIEIEWEGEVYKVRPSLTFINTLESERGSSLSMLLFRASQGDLPSGKACELIAATLNYAGAEDVTADDVFLATGGVGTVATKLAVTILTACMPDSMGKPATSGKKKSTSRGKNTKKPTSGNSTG